VSRAAYGCRFVLSQIELEHGDHLTGGGEPEPPMCDINMSKENDTALLMTKILTPSVSNLSMRET